MVEFTPAACRVLGRTALTGCVLASSWMLAVQPALARHHHHAHRGRAVLARAIGRARPMHVRPGSYTPPFSVYAVDGNSGRVLYGQDENGQRHPASITKVMTLYLLFERLEKHQLTLDDRIEVSAHAASMPPTKLGLRPGSTIRIEDAVKAIVTKSSNDMAVAIAERLGGDEATFAQMMTRKAHALGMTRTNFVNASGLPDDMQLTTAHDLVILGRAIHDRYPRYFHFFSTPSFRYAGQFMQNHNHLMEQVEGMDGIKTGYTRSSGFNLLSSVSRNGHWLVSVVLGGKTRLGRDRIMADLISSEIDKCATVRTAAAITENPALEQVAEAIPVVQHVGEAAPPVEAVDDETAESVRPAAEVRTAANDDEGGPAVTEAAESVAPETARRPGKTDSKAEPEASAAPAKPAGAKAALRATPIKIASAAPDIALPRPRPAFVSGLQNPADRDMTTTGSIRKRAGRREATEARDIDLTTATPSTLKHPRREPVKVAALETAPQAHGPVHGWVVQVGAAPTVEKANDLIARAKGESHGALAAAKPFTEKVQKGSATLYRARFAGLEEPSADAACRNLKRAGMSCFTTKN